MHNLSPAHVAKTWRDYLSKYLPIIFILVIFAGLVVPATFRDYYDTQQGHDMQEHHLPQVNTFIARPFSIFDYPANAASTPGHHIALAWIARILGYSSIADTTYPIRLINALFGVAVVIVAWITFYSRASTSWKASILTVPLAFSSYVLFAAIWINTDDGALLWYELVVAIAASNITLPLAAVLLCSALVMWRQIYLPVTGIFVLSWLAKKRTLRSLPVPVLATVAPAAIVGIYYWYWKGLVPPNFKSFNDVRFQFATPLSALALIGLVLPFYFGYLYWPISKLLRLRPRAVLCITMGVAAAWCLGPTDHSVEWGRWGGVVWTLALHAPSFGAHSFAVLCLAIVGAIILVSMIAETWPWGKYSAGTICLVLYLVGYSLQMEAFQRYIEPQILFTYGFWASAEKNESRRAWLGPLFLAIMLMTLAAFRAYGLSSQIFSSLMMGSGIDMTMVMMPFQIGLT
jgi:hypothetical protein